MPTKRYQKQVPTPIVTGQTPFPSFPFQPETVTLMSDDDAEQLAASIPQQTIPQRQDITPVLTQEVKDRLYRNFTLDLTVARTSEPLGIRNLNAIADSITIIKADSAFSYAMNSPGNDYTNAAAGMTENEFEIRELYITNSAAAGQAVIRVVWNPRLIIPT